MIYVDSICVDPSELELKVNFSEFLSANVCPSNATEPSVSWSSSDPSIVTVNEHTGLVIALRAGSATIYATALDGSGVVGTCEVTVTNQICVEDIILNHTHIELDRENTETLTATVCPSNATIKSIYWRSDNPSVAKVDKYSGVVTGKAAGVATVPTTERVCVITFTWLTLPMRT